MVSLVSLMSLMTTMNVQAQVTIGDETNPRSYSLLELVTTQKQGGLRLPMLSTTDRDALKITADSTAANGLLIYNTDIHCLEFWTIDHWSDMCENTPSIVFTGTGGNPRKQSDLIDLSLPFPAAGQTTAPLVPHDNPECSTTPPALAYTVTVKVGADFTYITTVTPATGAFTIRMDPNPFTYARYAIINVMDNCMGKSQDFILIQAACQPPAQPSAITGSAWVAKNISDHLGQTYIYSVTNVPNVTYNWTVPEGWTIQGANGYSSITVIPSSIGSHGTISVTPSNGVCSGPPSTLDVTSGCGAKTINGGWKEFQCYNLGAAKAVQSMSPAEQAAYATPADEYGFLFQWGRQADGHESRTSPVHTGFITTFDANGQPTIGNGAGQFITNAPFSATATNDWREPQSNSLWWVSGKVIANDPCGEPDWRIPTQSEWQSISNGGGMLTPIPTAGGIGTSGNIIKWNSSGTPGMLFTPSGSTVPTLFLPAGGERMYDTAALSGVGTNGWYWVSTISGISAGYLSFSIVNINPNFYLVRAMGYSIRCALK